MKKRQSIRKGLILVSFLLFPVTLNYFSPYLIISGALEGIINGSFIVFVSFFVLSLFLGRAPCGWTCPVAGLCEACFIANKKRVRNKSRIKYIFWIPWIGGIVFSAIIAGGYKSMDFFYLTENIISVSSIFSYFVYLPVIGLVVALSFGIGKRGFCHTTCWVAPFMILGTKVKEFLRIPSLRLRAIPENCTRCLTCTKNCPMSLEVDKMVRAGSMKNSECILCGECVDGCPKQAIRFGFGVSL